MIYLFDICDTLFKSNTTMDFIRYYLKEKKFSGKLLWFSALLSKRSPLFYLLIILNKILHQDYHKRWALLLLRNQTRSELRIMADYFYAHHLQVRQNKETFNILKRARQEKARIILLSGTIDVVAESIAKSLSVEWKSSQLEFDSQDRFTGKILFDATGQKEQLLPPEIYNSGNYCITTDNYSDLRLVKKSKKANIVVHNRFSSKWKADPNVEFIYIQ